MSEEIFKNNGKYTFSFDEESVVAERSLMRNVYGWMTLALAVTGLMAYYTANAAWALSIIASPAVWVLLIAEIVLVFVLSARIDKMSFKTAAIMFALYSLLNGMTLSVIFLAYSISTIASAFFVTAGTFGGMALVGSFIKKDLSGMGKFLLFALIGLIIASIVNIFIMNSTMDFIISIVGVLLFAGLTAYDSQKIKQMLQTYGSEVNETTQKIALMGALSLYLDFINLFLYILRLFGRRD